MPGITRFKLLKNTACLCPSIGSKKMRGRNFFIATVILVWFAMFFFIPRLGSSPPLWVIITCASIFSIFSGSLVFLGESVIEDIVKVAVIVVLSAVLGVNALNIDFLFVGAIISGFIGVLMNHISQKVAKKESSLRKLGSSV